MAVSAFEKDLLDAAITAIQSPQAQTELTTLVTAGESQVVPLLTKALSGLKVGGIAGMILPEIESALESEIAAVVAKYGAAEIVAYLTSAAVGELKALGG